MSTTQTLDGYNGSAGSYLKAVTDSYLGNELATEVVTDQNNKEVGGTRYYYDLNGNTTQTLDGYDPAALPNAPWLKNVMDSYLGDELATEVVTDKNMVQVGGTAYYYDLDGNTLKICRGLDPQQERPGSFKTAGQVNYFVMVWQRQP